MFSGNHSFHLRLNQVWLPSPSQSQPSSFQHFTQIFLVHKWSAATGYTQRLDIPSAVWKNQRYQHTIITVSAPKWPFIFWRAAFNQNAFSLWSFCRAASGILPSIFFRSWKVWVWQGRSKRELQLVWESAVFICLYQDAPILSLVLFLLLFWKNRWTKRTVSLVRITRSTSWFQCLRYIEETKILTGFIFLG